MIKRRTALFAVAAIALPIGLIVLWIARWADNGIGLDGSTPRRQGRLVFEAARRYDSSGKLEYRPPNRPVTLADCLYAVRHGRLPPSLRYAIPENGGAIACFIRVPNKSGLSTALAVTSAGHHLRLPIPMLPPGSGSAHIDIPGGYPPGVKWIDLIVGNRRGTLARWRLTNLPPSRPCLREPAPMSPEATVAGVHFRGRATLTDGVTRDSMPRMSTFVASSKPWNAHPAAEGLSFTMRRQWEQGTETAAAPAGDGPALTTAMDCVSPYGEDRYVVVDCRFRLVDSAQERVVFRDVPVRKVGKEYQFELPHGAEAWTTSGVRATLPEQRANRPVPRTFRYAPRPGMVAYSLMAATTPARDTAPHPACKLSRVYKLPLEVSISHPDTPLRYLDGTWQSGRVCFRFDGPPPVNGVLPALPLAVDLSVGSEPRDLHLVIPVRDRRRWR